MTTTRVHGRRAENREGKSRKLDLLTASLAAQSSAIKTDRHVPEGLQVLVCTQLSHVGESPRGGDRGRVGLQSLFHGGRDGLVLASWSRGLGSIPRCSTWGAPHLGSGDGWRVEVERRRRWAEKMVGAPRAGRACAPSWNLQGSSLSWTEPRGWGWQAEGHLSRRGRGGASLQAGRPYILLRPCSSAFQGDIPTLLVKPPCRPHPGSGNPSPSSCISALGAAARIPCCSGGGTTAWSVERPTVGVREEGRWVHQRRSFSWPTSAHVPVAFSQGKKQVQPLQLTSKVCPEWPGVVATRGTGPMGGASTERPSSRGSGPLRGMAGPRPGKWVPQSLYWGSTPRREIS